MELLIDNKPLSDFKVVCLDYTQLLSIAGERENVRTWFDKSGVDKNLTNIRLDSFDFVLSFYCKASTLLEAHALARTFTTYMSSKGAFILTLTDGTNSYGILCGRSTIISPTIHIRAINGIYRFDVALKSLNPNAVTYYTEIEDDTISIEYKKGKPAWLYWGNGEKTMVTNSGVYEYTYSTPTPDGPIVVIADIDSTATEYPILQAEFSADMTTAIVPQEVQFTDESVGDVIQWAWDFGDGTGSSEQNPTHTYENAGTYTVVLLVYNAQGGCSTMSKTNYITINHSYLLNETGFNLTYDNSGSKMIIQ